MVQEEHEEYEMRNMSFALTKQQLLDGSKDVTRRLGWDCLRIGDLIQAVEKSQGLKKGEKIKRLAVLEVIKIWSEPLNAITQDEVDREGFPGLSPRAFIDHFCTAMRCESWSHVVRIEFRIRKKLEPQILERSE